jgi:hypothetical protein
VTLKPVLYLVGGPMRTGKTQIALRFNALSGISYVSADDLVNTLEFARPDLGIGHDLPGQTWRDKREALAPFLEGFARLRVEASHPVLIEGELHREMVRRLLAAFGEQVRACFVGTAGLSVEAKVADLRAWSSSQGDWLSGKSPADFEWTAQVCLDASAEYKAAAMALGIRYFDLSNDWDARVEAVVQYLAADASVPPPPTGH